MTVRKPLGIGGRQAFTASIAKPFGSEESIARVRESLSERVVPVSSPGIDRDTRGGLPRVE
jgi:hypothetical protein